MMGVDRDKYRAVFKRLETDEELRARVREAHGNITYITVERKITRHGWYGVPYEDTERTSERLDSLTGTALDDAVWSAMKMQRRIIEDVSR